MRAFILLATAVLGCGGPREGSGERAPTPPTTSALGADVEVGEPPDLIRMGSYAETLHRQFRPEAAMAVVAEVDRYFRVRGNLGYRRSLAHVTAQLDAHQVPHRDFEFGEARATWTPRRASLALVDGPTLIAFEDESEPDRAALLVGSAPRDSAELEVVRADADALRGRLVLVEGNPRRFGAMITEQGAAGLLVHNLESYHDPENHPDVAQFGYLPSGGDAIGFSLSERNWRALNAATESGPARVRAMVDVTVGQARGSGVEATIRGTDPDAPQIVFVAHIDEPGANDNASGVAALCELAIAMARAIEAGEIARPAHTVRFVWGQEMEVSQSWLAEDPGAVGAGLVFDMVGLAPEHGAPFLIERMPDPGAIWLRGNDEHTEWGAGSVGEDRLVGHFLNDALAAGVRAVERIDGPWRWRTNPYEGGSDHVPFLDRGVAAVLAWHFTDRAYHTTADRTERVSGEEMRRVSAAFGATALAMASGERSDAAELLLAVSYGARARYADVVEDARGRVGRGEPRAAEARVLDAWRNVGTRKLSEASRRGMSACPMTQIARGSNGRARRDEQTHLLCGSVPPMNRSPTKTIHFISLGCPKNRVDTEVMLGVADRSRYRIVDRAEDAAVIVVNTCGFIDEAKEESVETILAMGQLRESGTCEKLVVAGCLSQRYPNQLASEMPEVDHFLGSSDMLRLGDILDGDAARMLVGNPADFTLRASDPRRLSQGTHRAYVKIAEGCNRQCAFCTIPSFRGKQRSRAIADVVAEVEQLVDRGAKEINLISQDTVAYGRDLEGRVRLAELVEAVAEVSGLRWLRLFYLYPETIDAALIALLAEHPKVLPYIDMPLQHASDPMLRRMKRGHGGDRLRRVVERLRTQVDDLVFRTAFIVGHPEETEAEFVELLEFVRWAQFDRVGVFRYSTEEGTASAAMDGQVPETIIAERHRALMREQRPISRAKQEALVGRELEVLVEGESDESELLLEGRWWGQAPEIDGKVFLANGTAAVGELRRALVTHASDYDLVADLFERDGTLPEPPPGADPRRRLPVVD